jgi:hypothetical protein
MILVLLAPLFIRMPVWGDTTTFDIAARTTLRKGYSYREILRVGMPGMVWWQAGVRSLVGWSSQALRVADLVFLSMILWLLARGTQPRELPVAASVWIAAVLYLSYTSATEWSHCQPDMWMCLPALGALFLRQRQAASLVAGGVGPRVIAWRALWEGVLWGLAFLVKPFILTSAVPCLLLVMLWTLQALRKRETAAVLAADVAGLLCGGLIVGALSVALLVLGGDWAAFVHAAFGGWGSDYFRGFASLGLRSLKAFFGPLWPWSMLHLAAVPLALLILVRSVRRRLPGTAGREPEGRLALLAAFYLGWFFQANYVQRQFEYHLTPALLLAWALVLGWGWMRLPRVAAASAVGAAVIALVLLHPLLKAERLAVWVDCWVSADSDRLEDTLADKELPGGTAWQDLRVVSRFLREQLVRDREVTCWHFSAIPLLMDLDLEPSCQFLYPGNDLVLVPGFRETILNEVMHSPQRFVVLDLRMLGFTDEDCRQKLTRVPELVGAFRPVTVFHAGCYLLLELPPGGAGAGPRS